MFQKPRKIGNCTFNFVLVVFLLLGLAGSANAITYREDFEAGYFDGAELQYHLGWFQTRKNPETQQNLDMTEIVTEGSPAKYRLGMGEWGFIWIAHPFSWKQLIVDDYIKLSMDFKTNSAGTGNPFNDDRVGWNIKDDDSHSDHIFGVQIDGTNSEITGYWDHSPTEQDKRPVIASSSDWASGHPARSTWYRLTAKITKLTGTSAKIQVTVDELNDDGTIKTANVVDETMNDTSNLDPETDEPYSGYFTTETIWPAFKNYDSSSDGPADNAYFHIEDGLNDVADVEVTTNSATEGGSTGSFRVQLLNNPDEDVTVTCWPTINAKDIKLGTSNPGQPFDIDFEHDDYDWESVTVTAYNDDEMEAGEVATVDFTISSSDNNFNGHYVAPLPVKIKITDNDDTATFKAGPYLIYTPVNTEMMVLWQLDGDYTCTLKWDDDENFTLPLIGSSSVTDWTDEHHYKKKIEGLNTDTKYYYEVSYTPVSTTYKAGGSFYTASTGNNVKFLAYGDTRGNGGDWAYGHDPVCLGIMDTLAIDSGYQTFLLHVADWVQNGDQESDWQDNYFNRDFPNPRSMLANLPVMGCFGNHDGSGSLFDKYLPYLTYESGVRYGSFNYGPVHVAVVDTEESGFPSSAQENWLKGDMKDATQKWKIILLHKPGWSAGVGHGDNTSVRGLINRLETYLQQQGKPGTDIVFAGHNHYYARCKKDTVRHITTGGGGAPLHAPNPDYSDQVVKVKGAFQFCEIDIRDNVLYLIARNREGYICDAFALAKDGTPETWSFIVKDSSGDVVAWFDNLGNLALEGSLTEDTTPTASANDEFRVQDSGGDVAIIDATNGNMTIEGFLYQEQDMSQLSEEGFIVKNSSGDAVAFIDNSGNMYLQGALFDFPD